MAHISSYRYTSDLHANDLPQVSIQPVDEVLSEVLVYLVGYLLLLDTEGTVGG